MLNFCDFIQVDVFTTNHHLKAGLIVLTIKKFICYTVYAEIFAVFRGQYESAKIKIAKYFPISVKESSLEATSISAAVTSSFPLLRLLLFSFVPVRSFFQQVQPGVRPIMIA